ncbi:oligopeptide/dipeptide ABC transporter ATPase subunit [Paenibacillus alvei TS-15]|jgi:peptide/nickel transport system ATP-binding protein|uniref:Oligopeptide/dipeptide ABC transporter ATPase subunit n=3 Tax=Paenibacillus TaxID=44249 RepID=S9SK36_PAEAL|nr:MULTISPECIES: ABC transporter ATP-binding protein [Paenibacillus]EPY06127.1 oligopeptide/dipeptide ABC transporter ATPase subunit [Paenibacillus alvei TS-15]EPY10509.1 oligopeptide/dipeptide ABC transporter ATPase subunit [Paenibacillus alvei A6-6i-x]MCM3289085.1 ABC transporter ATP-binding protein [Paenibacillus sp. MER 180]MCY9530739.1 ABC transporter ATP-binding protein [Paenibacillus alvei]MDT8977222.1 ABC transporter ATP-binding protein [Paenibacillus sp. chi10]
MSNNLIEFRNLRTNFYTSSGVVRAVNDVSFSIKEGETLCVVGESGCGKSVTAMSLMRLVSPPGKVEGGQILYNGKDLLGIKEREMRQIRGNEIAMIFQEPMTSLNPVFTIGEQLTEPILLHKGVTKKEAKKRAIDLIELVGIPRAAQIFDAYPHELSGGMRQRIMIAIALSCDPKLLIADEPTTALDVTIQAQILDLMRNIKKEFNTAIMMITHDLGVVAEMADHVVVMYAGKVIEEAPVLELFKNPKHPYTQGLLKAKPVINERMERLYTIPGQVPNPVELGENCYFNDRCEHCMSICTDKQPQLKVYDNKHKTACWLYEKGGDVQ